MDSNSDLDCQWLTRLLKSKFHNDTPKDLVSVSVESAVPQGENYTSIIKRVKMRMITASGSKRTYSMIVKLSNESLMNEVFPDLSVFRSEAKIFTTILTQMEDLMEEFDDKRETLWAKLYGYLPYSIMALEDLKARNFVVTERTSWQSMDHALLVMRAIGRYHAMSRVLLKRGLISSKDDKGHYFAGDNTPTKIKYLQGALQMLSQAMLKGSGSWSSSEWKELSQRVEKQIPLICDTTADLYFNYDQKFETLNHGDLWSSNIMFKLMEYTDRPINVRFVDFQIPHTNTFMWDLTYYLYSSVVPSVRRANLPTLLQAYHQSLSDNLYFFKFPGYIPTLEDVISEANRLRPAAFAFVTTVLPVTSATTNEAIKLDKLLTDPPENVFSESIFTEEKFVREVSEDIKMFADNGVI